MPMSVDMELVRMSQEEERGKRKTKRMAESCMAESFGSAVYHCQRVSASRLKKNDFAIHDVAIISSHMPSNGSTSRAAR